MSSLFTIVFICIYLFIFLFIQLTKLWFPKKSVLISIPVIWLGSMDRSRIRSFHNFILTYFQLCYGYSASNKTKPTHLQYTLILDVLPKSKDKIFKQGSIDKHIEECKWTTKYKNRYQIHSLDQRFHVIWENVQKEE